MITSQRVGEASNLGPECEPDGPWMQAAAIRWGGLQEECRQKVSKDNVKGAPMVEDVRPLAFSYPQARRMGLKRVIAPGMDGQACADGWEIPKQDEFSLCMESVNGTGMKSIRERLRTTEAHIVCAQETWVVEQDIAQHATWAKRLGWKSVWEPAMRNEGASKGGSGGVAIFVRDQLGLRYPSRHGFSWYLARAVAAVVEVPAMRPMLVVSVYGKHGGWNPITRDVLACVAAKFQDQSDVDLVAIGGDFNCRPSEAAGEDAIRMMDATVVATNHARGTFRTRKGNSTIDYFVLSDKLLKVMDTINTVEDSTLKGHTPVQVQWMPQAIAWRGLDLRPPIAIAVGAHHRACAVGSIVRFRAQMDCAGATGIG